MKILKGIGIAAFVLVMLILATKEYLGFHYYYRYKAVRAEAINIESRFSALEENLRRATRFSRNSIFSNELGRLYLEMALVENQFGTDEKRDAYLNSTVEILIDHIDHNPVNADSYYRLGIAYLFFNHPLYTYLDKAKACFQKALELKPTNEFLHLNILFIYLNQWNLLDDSDKDFVFDTFSRMQRVLKRFIPRLRQRWRKEYGSTEKLEEILSQIAIKKE